jgi:hypothetical protein
MTPRGQSPAITHHSVEPPEASPIWHYGELVLMALEVPLRRVSLNHVAPKKCNEQATESKGEEVYASIQNNNDNVRYRAHERDIHTNRKRGRLEQENRDHV